MSHEFDDVLRRLPEYELPEGIQQEQLNTLSQLPPPQRRPRRSRRVLALTAGAVIAAGGIGVGTAAALGVFSAPPTDRSMVHCFATADLHDPGNHTDEVIALPPGADQPLGDIASQALEICASDWQQGRFSTTDPKVRPPQPQVSNGPVPPLIACVLDNGQVGVFPGQEGTCASLGLPLAILTPPPDTAAPPTPSPRTGATK